MVEALTEVMLTEVMLAEVMLAEVMLAEVADAVPCPTGFESMSRQATAQASEIAPPASPPAAASPPASNSRRLPRRTPPAGSNWSSGWNPVEIVSQPWCSASRHSAARLSNPPKAATWAAWPSDLKPSDSDFLKTCVFFATSMTFVISVIPVTMTGDSKHNVYTAVYYTPVPYLSTPRSPPAGTRSPHGDTHP